MESRFASGRRTRTLLIAMAAIRLCACAEAKAPPMETGTATLLGSVKLVGGAQPVPQATITVDDTVVQANESGWFVMTALPPGDRVIVTITGTGMVPSHRVVKLNGVGRTFLDARLFAKAPAVKIDPATGGTVTSGRAKVVLKPGMLRTASGAPPTGMADVSLTTIDPTSREQRLATPGDFTAIAEGQSQPVDLESFGMVYLSVTDAGGEELGFAAGAKADVNIPVPTITGAPLTTSPLWRFDTTTGRWVAGGSATLDPVTRTYATTIDRPAYWNADQPYATACWKGTVVTPEGVLAPPGIKVAAEGVTYLGESISWTDANGAFAVRVMASTPARPATARLYAEGTGRYAELPQTVTPTALASTGACTDLGPIKLAFPLASMVLTWGATPRDLDSHFTGPTVADPTKRFHVSYSQRNVGSAFLDTDDTSAFGPEVTSLLKAAPGTYVYTVHNYSGEAGGPILSSMAQVITIFPNGWRTFNVADATLPQPLTTRNSVWRVFQFDIDAAGALSEIQPINEVVDNTAAAFQP